MQTASFLPDAPLSPFDGKSVATIPSPTRVLLSVLSRRSHSTMTAPFPILTTVAQVREWRLSRSQLGHSVGFVPTMGALHSGHLSLVKASLEECDETVVSIFVNPAQFAPNEDLGTYPRTLQSDLSLLSSISHTLPSPSDSTPPTTPTNGTNETMRRTVSALFLPPVEALYPGGITTDVKLQRGTFIEVKGLQDAMEGGSRPGFFRGVATVCLKLFNIIQPTKAYFGQKDIQQSLLLRRMLSDLHLTHPAPSSLIIHPTFRNPTTGLALSSRNAYLLDREMRYSTILIDALRSSERVWNTQRNTQEGIVDVELVLRAAKGSIAGVVEKAREDGVEIKLLYVLLNDPVELNDLEDGVGKVGMGKGAVLSGAVVLGKTRLIDNLVFDFELN